MGLSSLNLVLFAVFFWTYNTCETYNTSSIRIRPLLDPGGHPYKKDGGAVRRMSLLGVKGLGVHPQNVLQQEL